MAAPAPCTGAGGSFENQLDSPTEWLGDTVQRSAFSSEQCFSNCLLTFGWTEHFLRNATEPNRIENTVDRAPGSQSEDCFVKLRFRWKELRSLELTAAG